MVTACYCNFDDMEKFSSDDMFWPLFGKAIPSQETFRQRLDLHDDKRAGAGRHRVRPLRIIADAALHPTKMDSNPKRMRLHMVLLSFVKIGCKPVRHANTLRLK